MLNSCLPVMIDAIVENGGLVNKFAGDTLMGVWNHPKPCSGTPAAGGESSLGSPTKNDGITASANFSRSVLYFIKMIRTWFLSYEIETVSAAAAVQGLDYGCYCVTERCNFGR